MINPNSLYYKGIMTRLDFSDDKLWDAGGLAFKIAVDQPIKVWARWSISLDQWVVAKVQRCSRPTAKLVEKLCSKAYDRGLRFEYHNETNKFTVNGSVYSFETVYRMLML